MRIAFAAFLASLMVTKLFAADVPGTLKGDFSVSLSGSAQYNIPIVVPEGTSGMTPKVVLSYDSNTGAGNVAMGWSVTGLSFITRTHKTHFIDGAPAAINFSDEDAFALDGSRLVAVPGSTGLLARVIDDQTRVEIVRDGSGIHFVGRTKAGLTMFYETKILTANGNVLFWACNRIVDTFGNAIRLRYKQNGRGDWGIETIDYTENEKSGLTSYASIEFRYVESDVPAVAFIGGERVEKTFALNQIESKIEGKRFRRYDIELETTGRLGGRRLISVREIGADLGQPEEGHRATQFQYEDPRPEWRRQPDYNLPSDFGFATSLESGYRFIDLDGDGVAEIVYAARLAGRFIARTYKFEGSSWVAKPDLSLPSHLTDSAGGDSGVIFFDVDGDGSLDVLFPRAPLGSDEAPAYQLNGGKWQPKPEFGLPEVAIEDGNLKFRSLLVGSPTGVKQLLTLGYRDNAPNLWSYNVDHWVKTPIENRLLTPPSTNLSLLSADVDCDGKPEIILIDKDAGTVEIAKIAPRSSPSEFSLTSVYFNRLGSNITTFATAYIGRCGHLIATSGDKLVDFYLSSPTGTLVAKEISIGNLGGQIFRITPANFSGDAKEEFVVQVSAPAPADLVMFVYGGEQTGWSRDATFDHNAADVRISSTYILLPADLNRDGRQDLLLLPTTQILAPFGLLNQGQGWSRVDQFVPDIAFSQDKKPSTGLQFVDLNGDGLADLIGYNIDENGKEAKVASLNTGEGWRSASEYLPPASLSQSRSGATGQLVDVTGDGIPDFLHAFQGNRLFRKNGFDAATGQPLGWVEDPNLSFAPPEDFSQENLGDLGVRFLDLNGDGLVDMIVSRRESDGSLTRRAYLNARSGWQPAGGQFAPPVPFVSRHPFDVMFEAPGADYYRDLRVQLIDLNGDGLLDILYWYRFWTPGIPNYNPGFSRECQNVRVPNPNSTPERPLPPIEPKIPIDGNCAGAYLNTGNGWRALDDNSFPPIPLDINAGPSDKNATIEFVDINGDGLVDIVPAAKAGATNRFGVHLSTGRGWLDSGDAAAAAYRLPAEALSRSEKLPSHRLVDLNGDGLLDLAFGTPSSRGAFLNTGRGWGPRTETFAPPEPFIDADGNDLGVRFVDVDGNGLPDLLRSWRDSEGKPNRSAHLNAGARADTLAAVTNGAGLRIEFKYRSLLTLRSGELSSDQFYQPSPISTYPVISFVPTIYAVEELSIIEAADRRLNTIYRYKGFRFDVSAGAPLGFETREARSLDNSIQETVKLYQDFYRNGRTEVADSSYRGTRLSRTINSYEVVPGASAGQLVRVDLRNSQSSRWDLNGALMGSTRTSYRYDVSSNLLNSCVVYGDDSWTYTRNEYDPNIQNLDPRVWYLGRLTSTEVTHATERFPENCLDFTGRVTSAQSDEYVSNLAAFAYDPATGILTREAVNVGTDQAVTTEYKRDTLGNIISARQFAMFEKPRTRAVEFDSRGRFVVAELDALGHRSARNTDAILGVINKVADVNGVESASAYDSFGNLLESVTPLGIKTTQVRQFGAGEAIGGVSVASKLVGKTGDLPSVESWFDVQGRLLRTITIGFGGRRVIADTAYDIYGRKVKSSLPYFEGDAPSYSFTRYDVLGRPVATVTPRGVQTAFQYAGPMTTTIDAQNRRSRIIKNLKGLTSETIDPAGGKVEFSYGPSDRVTKVTSPGNRQIQYHYDQIGNRIRTVDPDLGLWTYRYNAFGQLSEQTDAKGQITTLTYDELGRPVRRLTSDKEVMYTYDAGLGAQGKVSSISSSDGFEEGYLYDPYGRLKRKATRVENELYSTSLVYDDYDRVRESYYQNGFVVFSDYDREGFLSQVSAKTSEELLQRAPRNIWKAASRDQYGRVTLEVFGNGVKTHHKIDQTGGYESSILIEKEDGTKISDLNLVYDVTGNLKEKTDRLAGRKEEFSYDPLYRLQSWKVNGNIIGSYSFDAAGRIISKSDVGEYHYSSTGPFSGVSRITSPSGKRTPYSYDQNGNMTFGPKGHLTYNSDNLVQSIFLSSSNWSAFQYAPDGTRYLQRARKSNFYSHTITVGPFQRIKEFTSLHFGNRADLVRDRITIATDSGVVAVLEQFQKYDPPSGFRLPPDLESGRAFYQSATTAASVHFLHTDQLGSLTHITNKSGNVARAFAYDPWGRQCDLGASPTASGDAVCAALANKRIKVASSDSLGQSFQRGFTGHDQLESLDLIHMNGRVFDPTIARFVSADPKIQFPNVSQNYDRYQYVFNNPFRFTDPSGFGLLGDIWDAVKRPFVQAWNWVEKNWKTVVVIVVAVVITVASAGSLGPLGAAILAGAVSGGLNAALYGGNLGDVLQGAFVGAAFAAVGGAYAQGVGQAFAQYGSTASTIASATGRGLISGMEAEYYGGSYFQGFASSAVSAAFTDSVKSIDSLALRTVAGAALGGTASVIGGGKFDNGAATGAFTWLITPGAGQPVTRPGTGDSVAFVGGFFDYTTDNAAWSDYLDYIKARPNANVAYFTWDQSDQLAAWIDKNHGWVYAHSWGGSTAARAVAAGHRVDGLVTVDPVSWSRPSYSAVAANSKYWINLNAVGGKGSFANFVAGIGGAWNGGPKGHADTFTNVKLDHRSIMDTCGSPIVAPRAIPSVCLGR